MEASSAVSPPGSDSRSVPDSAGQRRPSRGGIRWTTRLTTSAAMLR